MEGMLVKITYSYKQPILQHKYIKWSVWKNKPTLVLKRVVCLCGNKQRSLWSQLFIRPLMANDVTGSFSASFFCILIKYLGSTFFTFYYFIENSFFLVNDCNHGLKEVSVLHEQSQRLNRFQTTVIELFYISTSCQCNLLSKFLTASKF